MAYCDPSDPLLLLKIAECVSSGVLPGSKSKQTQGTSLGNLKDPLKYRDKPWPQLADGLGALLLLGETAPAWYTSMAFGGLLLTRTVAITIHAARRSTRLTVSAPVTGRRRGWVAFTKKYTYCNRTCCSWAAGWFSTWWWPS
jgi:hypothetical protein